MAYRLDPTLPVGAEVRRVIGEQLALAEQRLRGEGDEAIDAQAVRDARKNLKKARAAIDLARADLGRPVARQASRDLRSVGAILAGPRDLDALAEAAARLADGAAVGGDEAVAAGVSALAATLAADASAARVAALDRRAVGAAGLTLRRTAAWLALVRSRAEGWDALGPGCRRTYRRARGGFAALGSEPTADELHGLRKLVKALWYQERLLRGAWPDGVKPGVVAADALGRALGDDHDLALLRPHLAVAVPDAVSLVDHEQRRLRAEVARLGQRLFVDDPATWEARHAAWWALAAADGDR